MHGGGTAVNMFVNGELTCKSTATFGGERESIVNISYCQDSTPVVKGDKIRTTADYDLKAHPA
jgi:hypothetical protein